MEENMVNNDVYFGNWKEEEMDYFPKRRVNNKLSWKIHHLMGSFYSNKMKRTIEYESMGECLFYYTLELLFSEGNGTRIKEVEILNMQLRIYRDWKYLLSPKLHNCNFRNNGQLKRWIAICLLYITFYGSDNRQ
jgi:hypothetical protein